MDTISAFELTFWSKYVLYSWKGKNGSCRHISIKAPWIAQAFVRSSPSSICRACCPQRPIPAPSYYCHGCHCRRWSPLNQWIACPSSPSGSSSSLASHWNILVEVLISSWQLLLRESLSMWLLLSTGCLCVGISHQSWVSRSCLMNTHRLRKRWGKHRDTILSWSLVQCLLRVTLDFRWASF